MNLMEKNKYLGLRFDPDAMIRLLGVQLYDTPLAMLRENVQNAYDAILERMQVDPGFNNGHIRIEINGRQVSVVDNGIGMDARNLQDNYWTAGHSGKNTEEAQKAGVVGHFGIGALANFGVCSRLEVDTLKVGHGIRYHCVAEKDKLDGQQIALQESPDESGNFGTKVTATLLDGISFTTEQAIEYLGIYVRYINIPVVVNDIAIQQDKIRIDSERPNSRYIEGQFDDDVVGFNYMINYQNYQPVKPQILISSIIMNGIPVEGRLFLNNDQRELFGLNNGFGISSIQLYSSFSFGGVADFKFLQPTAGRETISQEASRMLQNIFMHVEKFWAELIAEDVLSDGYRDFLIYVNEHFSMELARNIRISLDGYKEESVRLGDVDKENYAFYRGSDNQIKKSLLSSGAKILFPSGEQPRRRIQLNYLTQLGVEEKKDEVQVTRVLLRDELSSKEFMLLDDIRRTIEDDYIIQNVEVKLAEISMGVNVLVETNAKKSFSIFITPDNAEVRNLLENQGNYTLYLSLVKDYVRVVLYNQFVAFIPRDQKERAAYINEALERKREEFDIDYSDVSEIRTALRLLDEGKISNREFIERSSRARKGNQEQVVDSAQVGDLESVVTTSVSAPRVNRGNRRAVAAMEEQFLYVPQPPIKELNVKTDKKILQTSDEIVTLHSHRMFIALSPRFNRDHRSFMLYPHSTKVIWSMHRIIYIFTDQNYKTSLYYEMALTHKLDDKNTGGETLVSTTIITENAIFVPLPSRLYDYFSLREGSSLRFLVHYDKVNE